MIRPANVDWLASAYRHRGSSLAELVIANRHRDFTIEECRVALARVLAEQRGRLVELAADRLVLLERDRLIIDPVDPILAQGQLLMELDDGELEDLARSGLLDDFLAELGIEL